MPSYEQKLQVLVNNYKNAAASNENLVVANILAKGRKYLVEEPGDQTVGSLCVVLSKMEENGKVFIKRADLQQLYHKLYNVNTGALEVFAQELGLGEKNSGVKVMPEVAQTELEIYKGDEILGNALANAFDANIPLRTYANSVAEKALKNVEMVLDSWNFKPAALNVESGNEKFLIIRADYETPKGTTSFFVPIEVRKGLIGQAEVFMGNGLPTDLNNNNIKEYITTYAGDKLKISGAILLGALTKAASENREISATEMALTKLNAKREAANGQFAGQIVGLKVTAAEEIVKDVQEVQSDEFMSFQDRFTTAAGRASFHFGADKINNARDSLVRDLKGMGYNPQIRLAKSDNKTLFYNVSLDGGQAAFTVPVKIINDRIIKASTILCNGKVSALTKENISNLYGKNIDYRIAASSSPMFEANSADLLEEIRNSINDGNHAKAEDALNILATKGDEKAYAIGFNTYMQGLQGKTAEASMDPCCTMIIRNGTSTQPICGHTGLPISKVYTDKFGNCRPAYRRGAEESDAGSEIFWANKIFG